MYKMHFVGNGNWEYMGKNHQITKIWKSDRQAYSHFSYHIVQGIDNFLQIWLKKKILGGVKKIVLCNSVKEDVTIPIKRFKPPLKYFGCGPVKKVQIGFPSETFTSFKLKMSFLGLTTPTRALSIVMHSVPKYLK